MYVYVRIDELLLMNLESGLSLKLIEKGRWRVSGMASSLFRARSLSLKNVRTFNFKKSRKFRECSNGIRKVHTTRYLRLYVVPIYIRGDHQLRVYLDKNFFIFRSPRTLRREVRRGLIECLIEKFAFAFLL